MLIFLVGYLYCIFMLAVTSGSFIKGTMILLFLGLLPTWLILILLRRRQTKRLKTQPHP